jgi:hypothetical protein
MHRDSELAYMAEHFLLQLFRFFKEYLLGIPFSLVDPLKMSETGQHRIKFLSEWIYGVFEPSTGGIDVLNLFRG